MQSSCLLRSPQHIFPLLPGFPAVRNLQSPEWGVQPCLRGCVTHTVPVAGLWWMQQDGTFGSCTQGCPRCFGNAGEASAGEV